MSPPTSISMMAPHKKPSHHFKTVRFSESDRQQSQNFLLEVGGSVKIVLPENSLSPQVECTQYLPRTKGYIGRTGPGSDKPCLMVQVDWLSAADSQGHESGRNAIDLATDMKEYTVANDLLESADGLVLKYWPIVLRLRLVSLSAN
jgi:hypothetical protein